MSLKNIENIKETFASHVKNLQDEITKEILSRDPECVLTEDLWERDDHVGNPGGGGRTRAFSGKLIENAGVNTSLVHGKISETFAKQLNTGSDEIWATGISLIIHPRNPKVPTVHANFRLLHSGEKAWFGGGADLTPYYPFEEDFAYFHKVWKDACAPYECYDWMKKECDQYFTNHHRDGEMRGIGGLFFDHYNSGDLENDQTMVNALSEKFIKSYFPIVDKRKDEKYTEEDEDFQLHRRGRYVEFNLIHDRGTHFGLKSNGRTDSILISLPARCKFSYAYRPPENGIHDKMWEFYKPKAW